MLVFDELFGKTAPGGVLFEQMVEIKGAESDYRLFGQFYGGVVTVCYFVYEYIVVAEMKVERSAKTLVVKE